MPVNATALLKAWSQGDQEALHELIPLVHQESDTTRKRVA
jgi:hypothetical protein